MSTTTHQRGDAMSRLYRTRWFMPAFSLFLGGRRSETIAGIGGTARDERWERIDVHATALAGSVLIAVIIGCFLVEVAQGEDGSPYSQLGAIAGIAYIASVAFLRWRA